MADEPRAAPVVVGRFTRETVGMMRLGSLVIDEGGRAFEVAKVDPTAGPTGLVTVWGYPLTPKDREPGA